MADVGRESVNYAIGQPEQRPDTCSEAWRG